MLGVVYEVTRVYEILDGLNIPKHIAIIMDGNGRWAKQRGKKRTAGHKAGSDNLKKIARAASDMGVKYLTVYAFSTENWRRPDDEVSFLMGLMRQYLKESVKNAKKDNMRVRVLGRKDELDDDIIKAMTYLEEESKEHTGLNLQLAINYGGRDEIIRGINAFMNDKRRNPELQVTEETFGQYLDTNDMPDPELMIRTSGEIRSSNFLIWQLAYTEFCFVDKFWPDFSKEDLVDAILDYNKVERRFGGLRNES